MTDIKKYKKSKICLIGLGKVGSAVYHSLTNAGFVFSYIIDKNKKKASEITGNKKKVIIDFHLSKKSIENSDVFIIAVDEKNIPVIINKLSFFADVLKNKIIFHTSGIETSDAFLNTGVEKKYTGSFHPLQTFNSISYNNNNILQNIYFGIEGGKFALKYLKNICKALGSKFIVIPKNKKILYHSACVIASNYLVTHFEILSKITNNLTPAKKGIEIFEPIVKRTISNIFKEGAEKSLTGPFARGDVKTIDMHLNYIKKNLPSQLYYYALLGLETVIMAKNGKHIDSKTAEKIEKLLLNKIINNNEI
jgi:predicted short-subunit dehydrogenase-like oxidoreductase (DUF2520 family)